MMKNTGSTRTFYLNSMILFFSFLLAACGGGGSSNSSTGGGQISSPPPSNSYADNCVANFNEWKDDPARPIVELLGSKVVQLRLGDSYEDAGALAYDDVDGDLSTTIVVHGLDQVNTQSPGDYLVLILKQRRSEGVPYLPDVRH